MISLLLGCAHPYGVRHVALRCGPAGQVPHCVWVPLLCYDSVSRDALPRQRVVGRYLISSLAVPTLMVCGM